MTRLARRWLAADAKIARQLGCAVDAFRRVCRERIAGMPAHRRRHYGWRLELRRKTR